MLKGGGGYFYKIFLRDTCHSSYVIIRPLDSDTSVKTSKTNKTILVTAIARSEDTSGSEAPDHAACQGGAWDPT